MRHMKGRRKLSRTTSHRKAMLSNMVTSLMMYGRIQTTDAKAKELRRIADRIISLSKRIPAEAVENAGDELSRKALAAQRLHAIRQAGLWVRDRDTLLKVFNEYSKTYAQRNGGYTRVLKVGVRAGDSAPMSIIELV